MNDLSLLLFVIMALRNIFSRVLMYVWYGIVWYGMGWDGMGWNVM